MLSKRILANASLAAAGYKQITGEVFVRRDRDLFVQSSFGGGGNAQNTVLAIGPSAFGFINGAVYHNICDLHAYMKAVDSGLIPVNKVAVLTQKSAQRRAMLFAVLQLHVPSFLTRNGRYSRVLSKWQRLGLVVPTATGYATSAFGRLWYNHMKMDLLPFSDSLKALRMLGSVDELKEGTKGDLQRTDSHLAELILMIQHSSRTGPFRLAAFQAYLRILQTAFFDNRSVGFTGHVD